MKVYIIAGKAGSGKNEVASLIKKYYEEAGKKSCITEVSKYIKNFAKELLSWDGNEENKPRKFLQDAGYLIRHELFNEDILINRMLEDAKVYEKFVDVLIISDIRLPREVEVFKEKLNAITIRVNNLFSNNNLTADQKSHETEIALDNYNNFDYEIDNDNHNTLALKVNDLIRKVEE